MSRQNYANSKRARGLHHQPHEIKEGNSVRFHMIYISSMKREDGVLLNDYTPSSSVADF